jgi:hypothetical protein
MSAIDAKRGGQQLKRRRGYSTETCRAEIVSDEFGTGSTAPFS